MYMRELLVSFVRRWYLVVAALILTLGACVGMSKLVAADYESKASLVLLPPKNSEYPDANRFLTLSQLGEATGVVIRGLNGDDTHRAVAPHLGDGATYTVEPDYTTNAPILVITVSSPTADGATSLLTAVEAEVPSILNRLQDDVSIAQSARITSVPLTSPEEPTVNSKKQLRAVVATGVGLAALLAMLIGATDGYLIRRRSLRQPLENESAVLSDLSTRPVDIVRAEHQRKGRSSPRRRQLPDDDDDGSFDRANLG